MSCSCGFIRHHCLNSLPMATCTQTRLRTPSFLLPRLRSHSLCICGVMYACASFCVFRVCLCTCAGVCVRTSSADETVSDLIQLKTNTLFRLQTLSWKQAGFRGKRRKGQTAATHARPHTHTHTFMCRHTGAHSCG